MSTDGWLSAFLEFIRIRVCEMIIKDVVYLHEKDGKLLDVTRIHYIYSNKIFYIDENKESF